MLRQTRPLQFAETSRGLPPRGAPRPLIRATCRSHNAPVPDFPKLTPQCGDTSPSLGDSGVLSSQSRTLIFSPAHIVFLGRRGVGAQSPKRAGLRKGGRRGLGARAVSPLAPSPRPGGRPHPTPRGSWAPATRGPSQPEAARRGAGGAGKKGGPAASRCSHRRSAPQRPGVPSRQTPGLARPAATGEAARRRDPRGAYLRAARRTCRAARSSSRKAAARGGAGPERLPLPCRN